MTDANMREAPYPADTRAKGWRFELDLEQIDQSDTWALTPPEMRPWLLMLWASAWRQAPCGSLPDDDALICVRIGMKASLFAKHRAILMRGWWKAADGRLYHDTVSKRVLEMVAARDKERNRKAEFRKRKEAEEAETAKRVAELSRGTDTGQGVDNGGTDDTRTGTSTGTNTYKISVPIGTGGDPPPAISPEEMTKLEIWHAGKAMLERDGMPKAQCGSFIGKLVKDYGDGIVLDAVRAAAVARPADTAEYLKASCQRLKGERGRPNRQEALESNNRSAAEEAAAEIIGGAT
jgi:hypothetical protein